MILKSETYHFHRLDLSRQGGFVVTVYDEDGLHLADTQPAATPDAAFAEGRNIVDNKIEGPTKSSKDASGLTLKRNPNATQDESYNVFFEGRYVGRIFYVGAGAPKDAPWFWGLEFHEWQGSSGPQYGNVVDLEAGKQAFRAAWERRPKRKP